MKERQGGMDSMQEGDLPCTLKEETLVLTNNEDWEGCLRGV